MTIGITRQRTAERRGRWSSACAAAALAAVVLGVAACGGGADADKMPDVAGKQEAEARTTLEDLGLTVTVTKKRSGAAPGVVLDQSPHAGELIPEDGKVAIVVEDAAASGATTVPDVVGKATHEAESQLTSAGFQRGAITRRFSSEAADTVLDQNPRAGTNAEAGTLVDLVVADDSMATVPNVVGDDEGEALRKLTEQRLRVGNVRRALEGGGRPGAVMEQNPRPDVMVARETPVDLVIREDGVRVPSVQNRVVDDVATVLLGSGLQYKLAYQIDPKRPLGTILSLAPAAGQLVPRNSVVTLTLSKPRGRPNDWAVADVQKFKALEQLQRKIQMRNLGPGRINQPIK